LVCRADRAARHASCASTLEDATGQHWRERLDRVVAVLNRDAPPSVDRFVLSYRQRGMDIAEHVLDRDAGLPSARDFLRPASGASGSLRGRAGRWNLAGRGIFPLLQRRRAHA
jgi:hypothetical protein